MRLTLTLFLLIATLAVKGQTIGLLTLTDITFAAGDIKQRADTTVLNKGKLSCHHDWVFKKPDFNQLMIACVAMHGPEGCPNNWPNDFRVCKACLRHENIRVIRWYVAKQQPDTYEHIIKNIKP